LRGLEAENYMGSTYKFIPKGGHNHVTKLWETVSVSTHVGHKCV